MKAAWRKGLIGAALALAFFAYAGATALAADRILLATTTSTDNTGLLDYLAPKFQEATGIELRWVAVGTGKALELGKNCDVDALLVHAPAAEERYVAEGYGVERTRIMYNDFVLIGPKEDPAGIRKMQVTSAFQTLARGKALFVSRGDNSGTHKKELSLWKAAGIPVQDKADWYLQTGQGMLATIRVAAERRGYTLTDRGTYIKYEHTMKGDPPLVILVEGDEKLLNQYSALMVNPQRCPQAKADLARTFIHWLASPETQNTIADYKLLGKALFTPNAAR
ncbi:tungstate transport system substrate-binding protein [Desulfacinum hydrothermale DSM 13146]|uniref:Tungstate transport system substrate-binding protein n=1 Tax=Desulfacinum hydrothermale DSM 13146 TaxID=1121390 RepID=A0A1W1XDR1_9BACT|nr:substrate-binding domain-containing protein [Desulfacinum hydrothermale]SMC22017.1 tungstate transport system substrate-binding protein [Desulfacinum hydrothermale DSM 13146]